MFLTLKYLSVFGFQGTIGKLPFAVGLRRLELPTSRLSGVRSNRLSYKPISIWIFEIYGDGEIRTLDPLLARQVLSQLSYAPDFILVFFYNPAATYSPISSPT